MQIQLQIIIRRYRVEEKFNDAQIKISHDANGDLRFKEDFNKDGIDYSVKFDSNTEFKDFKISDLRTEIENRKKEIRLISKILKILTMQKLILLMSKFLPIINICNMILRWIIVPYFM